MYNRYVAERTISTIFKQNFAVVEDVVKSLMAMGVPSDYITAMRRVNETKMAILSVTDVSGTIVEALEIESTFEPPDWATLQVGDFRVMVQVTTDRTGQYQQILATAGGEKICITTGEIPAPCQGRCDVVDNLIPEIRTRLSESAQSIFVKSYNATIDRLSKNWQLQAAHPIDYDFVQETMAELKAEQSAWETVHQYFEQDENGVWSRLKPTNNLR